MAPMIFFMFEALCTFWGGPPNQLQPRAVASPDRFGSDSAGSQAGRQPKSSPRSATPLLVPTSFSPVRELGDVRISP